MYPYTLYLRMKVMEQIIMIMCPVHSIGIFCDNIYILEMADYVKCIT